MDKEEKIIAYKVVMNKLDNFLKEHDVLWHIKTRVSL
jgi:hypothetical protein